jgi:hypothetical protein
MRSVADALRAEDRERVLAMTPAARVARALSLGRRDRQIFAAANGVTTEDARRVFEAKRRIGRQPSRCFEELGG